ncbi:hypothetical protein [Streptomyces sp. NBC_00989]|uniref:hypothetical protein n=1 Tax=Streptomyces sp. NBC_00989 TaxID=2903705 RepID=UPI002F912AE4|nr:hypothetical protein OG714_54455 [Streptomyces sp. NBC_00989]
MSGRGRKAVLPPAGHRTEPPLAPGGFVVTVTNKAGYGKEFDFTGLPVAGPVQQSLAAAFAALSRGWTCHKTAGSYWGRIRVFAAFVSGLEEPPGDLDALTAATMRDWRERHIGTNTGRGTLRSVRLMLRRDPRLAVGPVAEELARRISGPTPRRQSYGQAERDRVVLAAQRQFRAAWLRICENTRLLDRWRAGGVTVGSREWRIGRILDHLARTGDVPLTLCPSGRAQATHYTLLGGRGVERTWGRLFATRGELTALAVLLTDRFGWNLSLYDRLPAPTTAPSAGETASVTYQVQIEKHRAGGGRWFSTENITDSGADSPGRLITQALEVTAHARALANILKPGSDLLMAARAYQREQQHRHLDRPAPVGPLAFGVSERMAQRWAHNHALGGSPFQRARRTTVTDQGRPLQHTRGTHESVYVLPDHRVQHASREVFEAGAREALEQAHTVVFGGTVTDGPDPGHQQTATVDCQDEQTSPWPAPGGGCAADFLLCLACPNAHVHPGHHPRLAHLHQQILSLRSALDDRTFGAGWNSHLQRLQDLRGRIGPAAWSAALARVTETDRTVVQLLVNKDLAP